MNFVDITNIWKKKLFKSLLIYFKMDYGFSEKRKKKRDKYKEKKKHPYKAGGKYRVIDLGSGKWFINNL